MSELGAMEAIISTYDHLCVAVRSSEITVRPALGKSYTNHGLSYIVIAYEVMMVTFLETSGIQWIIYWSLSSNIISS